MSFEEWKSVGLGAILTRSRVAGLGVYQLKQYLTVSNIRKAISIVRGSGLRSLGLLVFDVIRQLFRQNQAEQPPLRISEVFRSGDNVERPTILVVAHIYYPDYVQRTLNSIKQWTIPNTTFVVTSSNQEILDQVQAFRVANSERVVHAMLTDNQGRNFGPLLAALRTFADGHEILIHVHSKKSTHANHAMVRRWSNCLWNSLVEDQNLVRRMIDIFVHNDEVALSYPICTGAVPSWAYSWSSNFKIAEALMKEHNFKGRPEERFAYPAGGMFAARIRDVRFLLEIDMEVNGFPNELGQLDGTPQHAIERLVGHAPLQLGKSHAIYVPHLDYFTKDDAFVRRAAHPPTESLEIRLRGTSFVSFDFFDTLYRRRHQSHQLAKVLTFNKLMKLGLLHSDLSARSYINLRNEVEATLRKSNAKNAIGDVRLDEISDALAVKLDLPKGLVLELEQQSEKSLALPRSRYVEIANSLASSGSKVFVISDSYYSADFLRELGHEIGLEPSIPIYSSSDLGARKDSGAIWLEISQIEKYSLGSYIHVGDNPHSDNQVPQRIGITTIELLSPEELWNLQDLPKWDSEHHLDEAPKPAILGKIVSDMGEWE